MKPLEAAPFMRPSFGAAWINTVRHFRTVNPRLRGFAPCKGEIPRVQNKVLCDGCISLSNAEGFRKKGLSPINAQIMPAKTVVMIEKNDGTFPFVMAKMLSLRLK